MSWDQVSRPHVGHRLTLRDPYSLKCFTCEQTLVIHREAGAATPQPARWRAADRPDLRPMPEGFKDRVLRTIAEQRRTTEETS